MRLVPIRCVRANSYLGQTIYDNNGNPLLKSDAKLTDKLLEQLKKIDVISVYIKDEYTDDEIRDVIKPELRQKSISIVKNSFSNIEKLYQDHARSKSYEDYINALKQKEQIINELNRIARELVDNILQNNNVLINLVDLKSMDNYTYQHSVNVATISIIIGLAKKLSKEDLYALALGALLHDIGKVFIPKEIIQKKDKLTSEEYEIIKTHPQKGYDYLKNTDNLPLISKMIILQHHEIIDGTGYPNGISKNKIQKLVNIVSIADVYDALTSNRPYREPMCPNDAFEYILANAGKMFFIDLVSVFSRVIVPYPKGTIVKLSNGDIGIVDSYYSEYPLRPTVKILKSTQKCNEGSIIDLERNLSLVISNIEFNYP